MFKLPSPLPLSPRGRGKKGERALSSAREVYILSPTRERTEVRGRLIVTEGCALNKRLSALFANNNPLNILRYIPA